MDGVRFKKYVEQILNANRLANEIIQEYEKIDMYLSYLGTDDVGSTNVEAVCKSGAKLLHRPMPTWINDRGDWGAWAKCPNDAPAVCGIKSRIDNGYPNRYFVTSID